MRILFKMALKYAAKKHKGQMRRDGIMPYITHPIAVANYLKEMGRSKKVQIVGLFHDLLEDTNASEKTISKFVGQDGLIAVKLLTKTENCNEEEYIENILSNDIAKVVKEADRISNIKDLDFILDTKFAKKYLEKTERLFKGKFSNDMDKVIDEVRKNYERLLKYSYTCDASLENGPIYRTDEDENSEVYSIANNKWIPVDKFFWADLGDDATSISFEAACKQIQKSKKRR